MVVLGEAGGGGVRRSQGHRKGGIGWVGRPCFFGGKLDTESVRGEISARKTFLKKPI